MLKRYIGPLDEVTVIIQGQDVGTVGQGEAIPIPDELVDTVAWDNGLWEDGGKTPNDKNDTKGNE